MYDKNDMDAAIEHKKEINSFFASHQYEKAYTHYMKDPNGGASSRRENTTLKQFIEKFHKLRNSDGMLVFESKLATLEFDKAEYRPITSIAGFNGRDKDTLIALINEGCLCDYNQPFHVSCEGYEFVAKLSGDPDFHEFQAFEVELKTTPTDWINAAIKLGFDIPQVAPGVWRFDKEGAKGIIDFSSPGEAAKAACRYAGALLDSGIFPEPDRLVVVYEAVAPGASMVVGQGGKIYQSEGQWIGSANCQSIDIEGFKSFWGRAPEDGDDLWMMPYIDTDSTNHAINHEDITQYLVLGGSIPPGLSSEDYREAVISKITTDTEISVTEIPDLCPGIE